MHWTSVSLESHRGHKEVTDLLAVVPFGHARGQCDLEHGVALADLPQPVENGPDLPEAQNARLGLHQRLLVLLCGATMEEEDQAMTP